MSVIVRRWCRACKRQTEQFRQRMNEDHATVTLRMECSCCGRKLTVIEKKTD